MKRRNQTLDLFENKVSLRFGGSLVKGNAKKARPLTKRHAVHLVLKSEIAKGKYSLLLKRNAKRVEQIILKQAKKFKVKVYEQVNVGNHIHLVARIPNITLRVARQMFHNFLRAVTGLIARHVLGAEKGSPQAIKFWTYIPFTRLVTFGREYKGLGRYMDKNRGEAFEVFESWGYSSPADP